MKRYTLFAEGNGPAGLREWPDGAYVLAEDADRQAERIATLEKDAARYQWLRLRMEVRNMQSLAGDLRPAINVRFGHAFFHKPVSNDPTRAADELDFAIDAAIGKG